LSPDIPIHPDQCRIILRAMGTIARANGSSGPQASELLRVASQALDTPERLARAQPIEPGEAAAALVDGRIRDLAVAALVVTACMDEPVTVTALGVLKRFATVIEPRGRNPWVTNLERWLQGRTTLATIDTLRRLPLIRDSLRHLWRAEGLRGAATLPRLFLSRGRQNAELAWRYKRLGLQAEGTLGRAYWEHMTKHRLPFPGEPRNLTEFQQAHDMAHVLTGYDTSPEGELQLAAFFSGQRRSFSFLFLALLMFQLGVKVGASTEPSRGRFQPERALRALRRGAATPVDPQVCEYGPLLALPLSEVRRRFHVPPD
jgi:hypothetical protein